MQQVTTQPETRDGGGRITVEASLIHMMNCSGGPTYIYQYVNRRGFRVIRPPNWSNAIGGRDFGTCQEAQSVAVNAFAIPPLPMGGGGAAPTGAILPSGTDISGTWRGTDGTVYQINQNGSSFTWTSRGGSETAEGMISGNSVSASWRNSSGSGGGGATVVRDTAGRPISVRWSNGNVFTR